MYFYSYLSVGLSFDEQMGDDLTSSCFVNVNGDVDVQSGYNLGKSNEPAAPSR